MIMSMESAPNQERPVVGIIMTSEDGIIQWRKKYDDNSVSRWEQTNIETNDMNRFLALKRELEEKYGAGIIGK